MTVQDDVKRWPFKCEEGSEGKPVICDMYQGEEKKFYSAEISSMIITKLKETAKAYLNNNINEAVITVPAYFNDFQRQATKDTASIAGLNMIRILNESTAIAIAYGLDKISSEELNVLVFHLEGGTFDASLLIIEEGVFEIKATNGNSHLGGDDFDSRFVNLCMNNFKNKTGVDMEGNSISMSRLRTQYEKTKRILSSAVSATIECEALAEGEDYNFTLFRDKFEELCVDLFRKCLPPMEKVL
jgi:heat shock protein 1/8